LIRKDLLSKIEAYHPEFKEEIEFRVSFLTFIKNHFDCFERSLLIGHITGSAWIVNQSFDKALLTHHKKLDRWLQLGGHADGESDIIKVAHAEATEESGLQSLKLYSSDIFDIDIHTIPLKGDVPEHLHYDVRFLFTADEKEILTISSESKDLSWVEFNQLTEITDQNSSISRMALKTQLLLTGNK
jgi:8-oxo-dGTP pyrophosphatase MutT (NUDIX family)